MFTFQLIHTIALLASIFLIGKCYAHPMIRQQHEVRPMCMGCGDECDKCEFGSTISTLCGIRECRRGPGQICGGPSENWGVCGDGLICSCNRCAGCSLDSLTCFDNPCLPHQTLESRGHLEILNRFPIDRVAK
ncbi:neuroparsin-A-like [Linepithema humile]|uniref:neuroparsin-A-like n=1 Tax=Linepithema humile TaxID=83485 RepID=UPI0006233B82|nr:PREDICTED: neuroparsin-A-like [Linepithema humile]XP_012216948.1 PREDICTED: neuroparsin-A-like [Linepithema humile]XP_012216949.1 PREDICTED: neuroparsin-A-like [Linepithema humile]XP_012216950.1 PREDICTED: neuroparsin-A-like [Linepithema humile]